MLISFPKTLGHETNEATDRRRSAIVIKTSSAFVSLHQRETSHDDNNQISFSSFSQPHMQLIHLHYFLYPDPSLLFLHCLLFVSWPCSHTSLSCQVLSSPLFASVGIPFFIFLVPFWSFELLLLHTCIITIVWQVHNVLLFSGPGVDPSLSNMYSLIFVNDYNWFVMFCWKKK